MCSENDMKQIVSASVDDYCDQLTDEIIHHVRGLVDYLRADNLRPVDFPDNFHTRVDHILMKSHRIDGARTLGRIIIESIEDHADEGLIHAGDALRKINIEEGS